MCASSVDRLASGASPLRVTARRKPSARPRATLKTRRARRLVLLEEPWSMRSVRPLLLTILVLVSGYARARPRAGRSPRAFRAAARRRPDGGPGRRRRGAALAARGSRRSCGSRSSGTATWRRTRRGRGPPRRAAARRRDCPILELKYEQWGVPLARPYALDEANTLMLGVRQTFPAWGSLDARGRAARRGGGQRGGRLAGAPAGGRGPGPAHVRRVLPRRPGAAPAPRARRA